MSIFISSFNDIFERHIWIWLFIIFFIFSSNNIFMSWHSFIILFFNDLSIISLFSIFVNITSINDKIISFNLFFEKIMQIKTKISLFIELFSFNLFSPIFVSLLFLSWLINFSLNIDNIYSICCSQREVNIPFNWIYILLIKFPSI